MDILLVARDASDGDFLDFLQEAGHTVTVADSALAAIALNKRKAFDAVIVDEDLPESSGFRLVERIKLDNLTDGTGETVMMLVCNPARSEIATHHGADSVIFKNTEHLMIASGLSARLQQPEAGSLEGTRPSH
jgi:DNA-binding response OmpR family regulator